MLPDTIIKNIYTRKATVIFLRSQFLGSENGHDLAAWHAVTENEYISGQFLWTGIDYMGEAHGWPLRASEAGLLTMAGFENPGFTGG